MVNYMYPDTLIIKSKLPLNLIEIIVVVGTVLACGIPYLMIYATYPTWDKFIHSDLIMSLIEEPFALILFIAMTFALISVPLIGLYMCLKNYFASLKPTYIKAIKINKITREVEICYRLGNKYLKTEDISSFKVEVHTANVSNTRPGVYKVAGQSGFAGAMAKSVIAADSANRTAIVLEALITIKNKNGEIYDITTSDYSFTENNMHSFFRKLVTYKPILPNFKHSFVGPKENTVDSILSGVLMH